MHQVGFPENKDIDFGVQRRLDILIPEKDLEPV